MLVVICFHHLPSCMPVAEFLKPFIGITCRSLNSNGFTGSIPPSIGNLTSLYLLDLADNRLTGTIPVSTATTPGLDLLVHTKHLYVRSLRAILLIAAFLLQMIPFTMFVDTLKPIYSHLGLNQLSGTIPPKLFSSEMKLIHV